MGFANGSLNADASSVRLFTSRDMEIMVAQSYSKNLGLHLERIGAINIVCSSTDAAMRVKSQLKTLARPMHSNPPVHGGLRLLQMLLVIQIFLMNGKKEMEMMAGRMKSVREKLFGSFASKDKSGKDWSFSISKLACSFTQA
ncbi:Aspartate aminotransferase, cytoplasmic [Ancistrocladus abbreviatus]